MRLFVKRAVTHTEMGSPTSKSGVPLLAPVHPLSMTLVKQHLYSDLPFNLKAICLSQDNPTVMIRIIIVQIVMVGFDGVSVTRLICQDSLMKLVLTASRLIIVD